MEKFILLLISVLFINSGITHSQDSSYTKPIFTKKFDLTTEYITSLLYKSGLSETQNEEKVFEDCNEVYPISDSNINITHKSGRNVVLFKNIIEISFKGKKHTGDGIVMGGLGGLLSGLLFTFAIMGLPVSESEQRIGLALVPIIAIPTFIISGITIGWIIGANTYDKETYDFSKYKPTEKKGKAIKLLLQHQINF